jgi:hypothetical protein
MQKLVMKSKNKSNIFPIALSAIGSCSFYLLPYVGAKHCREQMPFFTGILLRQCFARPGKYAIMLREFDFLAITLISRRVENASNPQ